MARIILRSVAKLAQPAGFRVTALAVAEHIPSVQAARSLVEVKRCERLGFAHDLLEVDAETYQRALDGELNGYAATNTEQALASYTLDA